MLPSMNFNNFLSSIPGASLLTGGVSLAKEIAYETYSQALGMVPAAIVAFSNNENLKTASNTICGTISIINGLKGYASLYQSNEENEDPLHENAPKPSKFMMVAESTRDIGFGCLLLASSIAPNPSLELAIGGYYGASATIRGCRAYKNLAQLILGKTYCPSLLSATPTTRQIAKIIVDASVSTLQVRGAMQYLTRSPSNDTEPVEVDSDYFIFRREHGKDVNSQVLTISQKAFDIIQIKSPKEHIFFNATSIIPFDNAGTCSAMALDFVARYNTNCKDDLDQLTCVKGFADYYKATTEVYTSVQAAFNTINVVGWEDWMTHDWNMWHSSDSMTSEMIADSKMQSLANYHDLTLTPVTRTFNTFWDQLEIEKEIDSLDCGSYVMRKILPKSNNKLESIGHTVSLIKNKEQTFYYDNANGLLKVSDFAANIIFPNFRQNFFYKFRIYKAECPSTGCVNLNELKII